MTTPAFDAARNDLVSQRDECERQAEYHRTIAEGFENKHNVLDHQILGMDSAAKLLAEYVFTSRSSAAEPAPEPSKPARQDVRGAVLETLERGDTTLAELVLIRSNLKPGSIAAALRAAVKAGEVEMENGIYWLRKPLAAKSDSQVQTDETETRHAVSQARLDEMRAALKRIGSGVLVEAESFILPETIDLAIEQGWARRENGRLYLVEQTGAAE